jgi:hypothetical protein
MQSVIRPEDLDFGPEPTEEQIQFAERVIDAAIRSAAKAQGQGFVLFLEAGHFGLTARHRDFMIERYRAAGWSVSVEPFLKKTIVRLTA